MVPKLGGVDDLGSQYDVGSVVMRVVVKIFHGRQCGVGEGGGGVFDGVRDRDNRVREWGWRVELLACSAAFNVQGPGRGWFIQCRIRVRV